MPSASHCAAFNLALRAFGFPIQLLFPPRLTLGFALEVKLNRKPEKIHLTLQPPLNMDLLTAAVTLTVLR